MDIRSFNREAWDRQVRSGRNPWTQPVSPAEIAEARAGRWSVLLTGNRPVPPAWFPPIQGLRILALACGGGQQGPVLAAAGAQVTVLDNSPAQLARDREVAEREGLPLLTIEGDMRDLSAFADESFDLVFHPVSNLFVPEIRPVWNETCRVLRPGGWLLAGFMQPLMYIFDDHELEQGRFIVRHRIPYSDVAVYGFEHLQKEDRPAEFGHSFTDQIGGQLDAGFILMDLYEDVHSQVKLAEFIPTYMATRARKGRPA